MGTAAQVAEANSYNTCKSLTVAGNAFTADQIIEGTVTGSKGQVVEHAGGTLYYNQNPIIYVTTPIMVCLFGMDNNRRLTSKDDVVGGAASSGAGGNVFNNVTQQETTIINVDNDIPFAGAATSQGDIALLIPDTETSRPDFGYSDLSRCLYVSLKRLNVNPYSQLSNISYIQSTPCLKTSSATGIIFGGDSFINKFSFKKTYATRDDSDGGIDTVNSFSIRKGLMIQTIDFFVESEMNSELRNSIEVDTSAQIVSTTATTYYPKQDIWTFTKNGDASQFTGQLYGEGGSAGLADVLEAYYTDQYAKNFYRYNTDFSKENTIKRYFALSNTFKFCSDCLNFFPHRIIYSNKTLVDSSSLEKRIFLANNATDVPNKYGEITNLFTDTDQLWVHTERSLFRQQTKPNELSIGANTVFVGVGEIFSIPAQQLKSIDVGYAGSKHKFATHTNEMGTYFVSAEEGKIFLMGGGKLTEVSLKGNRFHFAKELPMKFEKQYERVTGKKYQCVEGIADSKSVGFMSTYDYENKRWILHKRDYKIIDESTFDPLNIDFSDVSKYENKSWTVSFSGTNLIGWHSYLPDYMFDTTSELFLTKDNGIWTHNEGNFQTYFGVEHDHILEWVNNTAPLNTKVFNNLEYRQSCEKFDPNYNEWIKDIDSTFTSIVAYNDNQSTGLLSIDNKDRNYNVIDYTPSQALAFHKENVWKINQFRDYSINPGIPNFTKNWNSIQSTYPIDKVVNNDNIDYSKSQYELARLRGKYLIIRGTFNNPDKELKLSTELFNSDYSDSIR